MFVSEYIARSPTYLSTVEFIWTIHLNKTTHCKLINKLLLNITYCTYIGSLHRIIYIQTYKHNSTNTNHKIIYFEQYKNKKPNHYYLYLITLIKYFIQYNVRSRHFENLLKGRTLVPK